MSNFRYLGLIDYILRFMSAGVVENGAVEVAENWEDDTGTAIQQVEEKMRKVTILKRSEEERKILAEKALKEENERKEKEKEEKERRTAMGLGSGSGEGPGPQIKLLRRPNSGSRLEQQGKKQEQKKPQKSLEERQAAYDAARNRILGQNYKPELVPTAPVQVTAPHRTSRSKSPEQIRVPRFPAGPPGATVIGPPSYMAPPISATAPHPAAHPHAQAYGMPPQCSSPQLASQMNLTITTPMSVPGGGPQSFSPQLGGVSLLPHPHSFVGPSPGGYMASFQSQHPTHHSMSNAHGAFGPPVMFNCHGQNGFARGGYGNVMRSSSQSPPQEYTTHPGEFVTNQMCGQPLLFFDASRPPPSVALPSLPGQPPSTLFYTGPVPAHSQAPPTSINPQPLMQQQFNGAPPMFYSSHLDLTPSQSSRQSNNRRRGKKSNRAN